MDKFYKELKGTIELVESNRVKRAEFIEGGKKVVVYQCGTILRIDIKEG